MNSPASVDAVERPRVLVVEDDAAVRRSLQLLLRSRGIDVRAHPAARPAIADLEANPVACLITDLVIPELDGLALLHELREGGWVGPAILISGHLTPEISARAKEAGFDEILSKPLRELVLVETILRLIGR